MPVGRSTAGSSTITDSAAGSFEAVFAELSGDVEPPPAFSDVSSAPFASDVVLSASVASAVGTSGIVESVDASFAQPDRPLNVAPAQANRSIAAGIVEVRMK
jgi:hypothetical protein